MTDATANDSAAAFTARAGILTEGVKGLFAANGGAAIAILAFLGQVVEKDKAMAVVILNNLPLFAYGMTCALVVHFVRFFRAFLTNSATAHKEADLYTWVWLLLSLGSLGCFVVGIVRIGNAGAAVLLGSG